MSFDANLDRLVTVLEPLAGTRNALNEVAPQAWGELMQVYAQKTDASDGEKLKAKELGATVTARFKVRATDRTRAVTARCRLRCDGTLYDITGVKDTDGREGREWTAVARSDGG